MREIRPCIDFLITQKCNYRCSYCSQSKKFSQNIDEADDKTVDAFLKFLKTLDKCFEITISGGEPLCHPRFYEVIKEIKSQDLKLTVISNFSYPVENYKKIADIMGENLIELFVSYHDTQATDFEKFKNKAAEFNAYKNPKVKFTVASVLTDDNVEKLKNLSCFLNDIGVNFCIQHMRIKNSYVKYTDSAAKFLAENAKPEPGRIMNTFGKMCSAGEKFLLIYENGDAYRCYSSRFNKAHSLGNIKDKGFKLFDSPVPCLNKTCTCPKPIRHNMLDLKQSNLPLAMLLSIKNTVFLPHLVLKNFNVIKAKFKQGELFKK